MIKNETFFKEFTLLKHTRTFISFDKTYIRKIQHEVKKKSTKGYAILRFTMAKNTYPAYHLGYI